MASRTLTAGLLTSASAGDAGRSGFGHIAAIDGLRAVAILSVLIYHLRPAWLPGGWVGVDIFFVVSGFVVTASLAQLRFARLSDLLAYFYARRILRIVPALVAMLVLSTLASVLLMLPELAANSAQTALAAAAGASNILLAARSNDYFDPVQELTPFLHTWSLGVEEQFYLLFPFLFFFSQGFLTDKRRAAAAAAAVMLLSLLSLLLAKYVVSIDPIAGFFLMPTRLWELGMGMLLCLTSMWWRPLGGMVPAWLAKLGLLFALALLALAFAGAPVSDQPLRIALATVASFMLIALVCIRPDAAVATLLAHPAPVFVGKISYSLYLWHWPVFVFFRWTVGLEGPAPAAAAVALAFALALFSYYYVERPIRRAGKSGRMARHLILLLGPLSLATAAALIWLLPSYAGNLTLISVERAAAAPETTALACPVDETEGAFASWTLVTLRPACRSPGSGSRIFAAGDSHAKTYLSSLRRLAADTKMEVRLYYSGGCAFPPLDAPAARRRWPHCPEANPRLLAELQRQLRRRDVLFIAGLQLQRMTRDSYDVRAGVPPPSAADRDRAYREAEALLAGLTRGGARVIFASPTPMFRSAALRCSDWFNRGNPLCRDGLVIDRKEMLRFRQPVVEAQQRLARNVQGVTIFDPFPLLCPADPCSAERGDKLLFEDGDHLSAYGQALLYPSLRNAITAEREMP